MTKHYFKSLSEIYLDPNKRKKCTRCGKIKSLIKFSKRRSTKTGVYSICKDCDKDKIRKFRLKNPEYDRNYYEKNRETKLAYDKLRREKNINILKEYRKNYYEKNREKELEYAKKYKRNSNE